MAKDDEMKRVVEETNNHMWFLGSPVAICSFKLELDMARNSMFAYSKMMNVQPENIKTVIFDVICYDSVRKVVDTLESAAYYDLDIPRNGVFGMANPIRIRNNATRSIEFIVVSVTTVSGETWENKERKKFDIIMEQKSLINVQGDLNKDFINNCTKAHIDHTRLIFEPIFTDNYWMCACGSLNWNDEMDCTGCGVNRDWLIQNTSREKLRAQAEYRISESRKIRDEVEARIQTESLAQTEEFERRKERYQKQQKSARNQNRKKKTITVAVIAAGVCAACVVLLLVGAPLIKYLIAVNDLNTRNYDSAISSFESMKGYLDSDELIKQAYYEKAAFDISSGKPEEAMELLSQVQGYKDADSKYIDAAYTVGVKKYEEKNYMGASEMFRIAMLSSDQDIATTAAGLNDECMASIYEDACKEMGSKNYDDARDSFIYLGEYKDCPDKANYCTYMIAGNTYKKRNYAEAIEIYDSIRGYSDVDSILSDLENLIKLTSAAGSDGSPAVWNGYGVQKDASGQDLDYVFEFYLDGKFNFAVLDSTGAEKNKMDGSYKIEKDTIYKVVVQNGSETWQKMSTIKSIESAYDIEGKNTKMILTDPFDGKTNITMYGNIISDDNVSM